MDELVSLYIEVIYISVCFRYFILWLEENYDYGAKQQYMMLPVSTHIRESFTKEDMGGWGGCSSQD